MVSFIPCSSSICDHMWLYRASELLLSVSPSKRRSINASSFHTSTPARPRSPHHPSSFAVDASAPVLTDAQPSTSVFPPRHEHAPQIQQQPPEVRAREIQLEALDEDNITTARALMDAKEFTRAVHWVKDCRSAKAIFLSVYSQYLVIRTIYASSQTFDNK